MSSGSRIDVFLSERAKLSLGGLPLREAQQLALHLLTLRKQPRPKESRLLGEPPPEDRLWEIGQWEILYRIENEREVVIGVIRLRRAGSSKE